MERTAWSDERLDDISTRMDLGFRDLRSEITETRRELSTRIDRVDGRLDALQVTLTRIGGGILAALVGVIAAVLARGV